MSEMESLKRLREQTGAGLMDCKKAIIESNGDFDKAFEVLRKKGLATASKKAGRTTSEGIISSYIHMDRLGVLIEANCETDFVARTDDFKGFVKDLAMQVAAANPSYINRDDVPQDVLEKEREIYRSQITGKPKEVMEKIVEGKLEKFYMENCLMEQVFIKDIEQKKRIKDYVAEMIARFGENIVIKRFVRYQLGEACV